MGTTIHLRLALAALALASTDCGASHATLLEEGFDGTAIDPAWSTWRKAFVETGGAIDALPMPRDGFDYGHVGNGRGAELYTHVGDATWTDYTYTARVLVQAPDPLYNPSGMQTCDRGITIAFRVQRAAESWNAPASSQYVFSARAIDCGTDGVAGTWSLSRSNDYYFDAPSGWGANPQGSSATLAMGTGAVLRDLDWNDVSVSVVGTSIDVSINGVLLMHYDDLDPQAILSGGVGVLGWWENPFTVDDVSVTAL